MHLGKVSSVVSIPTAVLLAGLFFLPWLELSCGPLKIGTASGLQLATGGLSPSEQIERMPSQGSVKTKGETDKDGPEMRARPWAFGGLVAPALLALLGLLGAARRHGSASLGVGVLVLALAGLAVVLAAASVDYPELMADRNASEPQSDGQPSDAMQASINQAVSASIRTQYTAWAVASLILYALAMACGVGMARGATLRVTPKAHAGPTAAAHSAPSDSAAGDTEPGPPDQPAT